MSVSTLTTTYDEIVSSIGYKLGYGRTAASWSTDQSANVAAVLKSGLRRVYGAYDWKWLKIPTTITVWSSISGTISTVTGTGKNIITASTSVFYPTMVGKTLVSTAASYTISSYTSGTVVTVATDASADAGHAFTITGNGDFILPDDFGSIEGQFTHSTGSGYADIVVVGHQDLLSLRAASDWSGLPQWASIWYGDSDNSTDQKRYVSFHPTPDASYTLSYRYRKLPNLLVDSSNEYPFGCQPFSELIRVSCMAAAEEEVNEVPGVSAARYEQLLSEAIVKDGLMAAQTLGLPRSSWDGELPYERGGSVLYVGEL